MISSNKNLLYFIGLLLLLHAGYSSFEFHYLTTSTHHTLLLHHQKLHSSLPLDISIEAIIGFVIILVGAIVSIENPQYLSIDDKVINEESRYLKPIEMKESVQLGEKLGICDFEDLNSRLPFIDVNHIRKEYSTWASSNLSKEEDLE